MSESTVLQRLRENLPSLPRAERSVAHVMLANYPAAGLMTIARLAAAAGASGPTVVRLTERLGYDSYPAFQEALRAELTERSQSPLAQYDTRNDADVWAGAPRIFATAIERSFQLTEPLEFQRAVDMLAHGKRAVYSTGGRFSSLIAQSLAFHLEIVRRGVVYLDTANRASILVDIGRQDVVFIADLRRYQDSTIQFGRAVASRGGRIVLLTDQWLSPIAQDAAAVLRVALEAPSAFDSLVTAEAMVEALVAGVLRKLGDAPRERMRAYDSAWTTVEGGSSSPGYDDRPPPGRGVAQTSSPHGRRTTVTRPNGEQGHG